MTTTNESVVAVFATPAKAEAAVHILHRAGYEPPELTLISHTLSERSEVADGLHLGDDSLRDAAIGGGLGGLLGILGAASLITVGGAGMVILGGPIVATGTIVGALVGAMRGWGIHESHLQRYEHLLKEGKLLVVVSGDPLRVQRAMKILRETEATEVHLHATEGDSSPEVDDRSAVGSPL